MKKLLSLVMGIALTGCATYGPTGIVYTTGKQGVSVDNSVAPKKEGSACMNSIFALVAWGDASIEAAKENGQIKKVATINYTGDNVLGVWGTYCTVVKGE